MNRFKERDILLEMMARARLLSTSSRNEFVSSEMDKIKVNIIKSAVSWGFSDVKFKSDAEVRFRELLEEIAD